MAENKLEVVGHKITTARALTRDRLVFAILAGLVMGVLNGAGAQARDCVSAYNSIARYINDNRGFFSALGNAPEATKQRFERSLKNCIPDEHSSENRAKAQRMLARVLQAQGAPRATEAVRMYRQAMSTWSWDARAKREMDEEIADIFYAHDRWAEFADHSALMIQKHTTYKSNALFRSKRARALRAMGRKREAIDEYLASAALEKDKKDPYQVGNALKLMRELYRRPSCSVLDTYSVEADDTLSKLNDCLLSRQLPAADQALALLKKARYFEAQNNQQRALEIYQQLISITPQPPTFTSFDHAKVVFQRIADDAPPSIKIIAYSIQQGFHDQGIAYFNRFAEEYGDYLVAREASESGTTEDNEPRPASPASLKKRARGDFLMPTVDLLASNNGLDRAIGLLDAERQRPDTTQNDAIILLRKRAQTLGMAQLCDRAIADFTTVLALLPNNDANTAAFRQNVQYERAICYKQTGKFADAQADLEALFALYPKNWHEGQLTNEIVNAFVFRIEMTARAGDNENASGQIETLEQIFQRHEMPCEPCSNLRGLLN